MKKLLLLSTCVTIAFSLQAQVNKLSKGSNLLENAKAKMRLEESSNLTNQHRNYVQPVHKTSTAAAKTSAITVVNNKIACGNSFNVFGLLLSEGNNLNANQDLNTVLFTHRTCSEYVNGADTTSGDVNATYTTNYCTGAWDSTNIVTHQTGIPTSASFNLRYPTGGLFNPPGNTIPNQAYAVTSGPWHQGPASTWNGGFFASGRLDGQNNRMDTVTSEAVPPNGVLNHMPRLGSWVTDQGNYFSLGSDFSWNNTAGALILGYVVNKGTFDAANNYFTWSQTHLDATTLNMNDFGNMAFSQDGNTGYVVAPGADPNNLINGGTLMPVIWKTTDAGVTWNLQPFYDFSNANGMSSLLTPTVPLGNHIPFFDSSEGWDCVVDKNNNLHIFTIVHSSGFDELNGDGDSTGFLVGDPAQIMDVYGSGTNWAVCKVGDLLTSAQPADATSPWTNLGTGIGWNARLQIGRTQDGGRVFYGWIDSDPTISAVNDYPDIHVSGMNIDTYMQAPEMNVTAGTVYAETNLWMYFSTIILNNGGTYTIPMTTTDSRDPNAPGEGPVQHWSVCGVTMTDADFTIPPCSFTGIAQFNSPSGMVVSQNYPNPFNGMTSFDLTLAHPSDVSVEVTNYLGQVVYSLSEKKYETGIHKIDMDVSDLNSGLYLYTVKIGSDRVSKKMMIF
ncbi:MAG: T9SS type A sorting domain-containing protein [Bacteroidia bacterium]